MEAINTLIDGRFPVTLLCKGSSPLRSRVLAVHAHRQIPYLVLERPPQPIHAYQVLDLLFKLKGMPILGFSCPITRESDSILATMMPHALFSLELRQGTRLETPVGSGVTFFVGGRAKVNVCVMENISFGGVKLSGQLSHTLAVKDLVGPCTLSLAGKNAVVSREVTINKAVVTRFEQLGKQHSIGLKFDLSSSEEEQLREHLEFLGKNT